ncbi:MAG: hypothetical protein NTX61_13135 [Bacteroidetes bacterium]|nr:hypothetical protein [Bacteroidota bacterium]
MKEKFLIIFIVLFSFAAHSWSQAGDSTGTVKGHFSFTPGIGWSHYINSMVVISNNEVKKDFVGISARFMWEPQYRISMGVETGYYRIYKVNKMVLQQIMGDSRLHFIPLMLMVRMRIVDHFYLTIAPGVGLLYSRLSGIGDKVESHEWSFSNFEATASYLYPLNKTFSLGGEFLFFSIGKTNDVFYSLQAVCAIKLVNW